jgi:hypothetical protein
MHATVLQSGRYTWIGWCTTSPENTASEPFDASRMWTLPGVCPGASSTWNAPSTSCPSSIMSARPASTIGSTLSLNALRRIGLGSGCAVQCSYSIREKR